VSACVGGISSTAGFKVLAPASSRDFSLVTQNAEMKNALAHNWAAAEALRKIPRLRLARRILHQPARDRHAIPPFAVQDQSARPNSLMAPPRSPEESSVRAKV